MGVAAWPPAGMSNFGYPGFNYTVERIGPPTLVARFEDGTEVRRKKIQVITRRFTERWEVNRTDMDTMLDVYELVGTDQLLDRVTNDPQDATFGTTTAECRFEEPPIIDQVGPNWYHVTLKFIEVL